MMIVTFRFAWLSDAQLDAYCKANGTTLDDLKKVLEDLQFYSWQSKKTKKNVSKVKSFRAQTSILGKKIKIHYSRLFITISIAEKSPHFEWKKFATDVEQGCKDVDRLVSFLKGTYEKLEEAGVDRHFSKAFDALKEKATEVEAQDLQKEQEKQKALEDQCLAQRIAPESSEGAKTKKRPRELKKADKCMQDILLGFGLREDHVNKCYSNQPGQITLDDKLNELRTRLVNTKTTFDQCYPMMNFYLLWLNARYPSKFEEDGALFVEEADVYEFLTLLQAQKMALHSDYPYIGKVLNGSATFVPKTSPVAFSFPNGHKYLTSLTDLQQEQANFLNKNVKKLRGCQTIQSWEKNLRHSGNTTRRNNRQDHQKTVFQEADPLAVKERQSLHLLEEDTWISIRNHASLVVQMFMLSRMDELVSWRLSDLHVMTIPKTYPSLGCMDMHLIFIEQASSKNLKDMRLPDQKPVVRREEVFVCPQSSLALMLFERYVMSSEKELDLAGDDDYWWDVKLFKSKASATRGVEKSSQYGQRKQLAETTKTAIAGVCTHAERRWGAFLCSLSGIPASEIKNIGGWNADEMEKHYQKIASVESLIRLLGFKDGASFSIPRSTIDIDCFINKYGEEHRSLFTGFMSFLDDPELQDHLQTMTMEGFNAPHNLHATLLYLRRILFQDLYLYFEHSPSLRLFGCRLFREHHSTLHLWMEYCKEHVASFKTTGNQGIIGETDVANDRLDKIEQRAANLEYASDKTVAKLDHLIYLSQAPEPSRNKRARKNETELHTRRLTSLKPLADMNISDVVFEWTVNCTDSGEDIGPLKNIDQDRVKRKLNYNTSLKTTILQRRKLYNFYDYQCALHGGHQLAIAAIEEIQRQVQREIAKKSSSKSYKKNQDLCSLSALLKHLKTCGIKF